MISPLEKTGSVSVFADLQGHGQRACHGAANFQSLCCSVLPFSGRGSLTWPIRPNNSGKKTGSIIIAARSPAIRLVGRPVDSGQNLFNDLAVNVGQAEITSLETVGQTLVVDSQAMQDRCVQVMNVHGLVRDIIAEIVRLSMNHTRLDATAREPHSEIPWMVVATVIVLRQCSLTVDSPPKLPAPDH